MYIERVIPILRASMQRMCEPATSRDRNICMYSPPRCYFRVYTEREGGGGGELILMALNIVSRVIRMLLVRSDLFAVLRTNRENCEESEGEYIDGGSLPSSAIDFR